ncbi:hypothetical protein OHT68_30010 [Streptomyces canus]|uniref:2OG-Fe(II)-dependent halogenase WelO5 family protein n=1 Tax=Streptomyces canus TaxID=58343 RepID=UPI002E2A771A|nr:hypothetical protein [Streptomyces canus]
MAGSWDRTVHHLEEQGGVDGRGILRSLVDGSAAVVVLRGLLPPERFASGIERILPLFRQATATNYTNVTSTTVGTYLAKHLAAPDAYFDEAAAAEELTDAVDFDLADRIRERLADVLELDSFELEREPDGRAYAKKNVRIYSDGVRTPLHNDKIMRDAVGTGLVVEKLRHQLSVVVCLQECDGGGELEIHQKSWHPQDEQFKIAGGFGYDGQVVGDAAVHWFKPQTGDVYLLNPTYYHAIGAPTGTDRITMGFFFGFYDDALRHAVAWV